MLARSGALVRMLEHTSTPYEYIDDSSRFGEVAGRWGSSTGCFAPPVVVDGEFVVSQSTACCMYVGDKVGLNSMPGFNSFKVSTVCRVSSVLLVPHPLSSMLINSKLFLRSLMPSSFRLASLLAGSAVPRRHSRHLREQPREEGERSLNEERRVAKDAIDANKLF